MDNPAIDNEILSQAVYHVFLPPKLPQKAPSDEVERLIDECLAELVQQAAEQYRNITDIHSDQWLRMSSMLSNLARHRSITIDKHTLAEDLMNMAPEGEMFASLDCLKANKMTQDVLPIHIREQNAVVVVRKSLTAMVFEIFEAQAPNHAVMSTTGKLVRHFPGPAIKVPNTTANEPAFNSEISNFLVHMSETPLDNSMAKTKKAGSKVHEERDVADPHYITQLFTGILRGFGDEIEPRRVIKRIADEVLWHDARRPWRRSPIWLIIRVILQTSVDSAVEYKHFMVYLHAYILNLCCNDFFSSDLLATMRTKMARRLLKVQESASDSLINAIKVLSDRAEALLQCRWTAIQNNVPRFGPLNLGGRLDVTHSLPNSREYLNKVLKGRKGLFEPHVFVPSHGTRLDGSSGFAEFADGALTRALEEHRHIALFDFENAVSLHLEEWVQSNLESASTYAIVASCIGQYIDAAISCYTHDITDLSIMMLIVMELWMALDQSITYRHSLLLAYSPDVPEILLEPLLLRSSLHLKRANVIQNYLRRRHQDANRGSIFTEKLDPNSFPVQFFNQSSDLQNLKRSIEQDADSKRAEKLRELERLNDEHSCLLEEASDMECSYRPDQKGVLRHKAKKCQKCKLKRQANNMNISVHEWPLPSDQCQAEAAVFDLQCPEAIKIWRDTTYRILCDLGGSIRQPRVSPHCTVDTYSGLRQWAKSLNQRIILASSTKSFRQTHYAETKIPSTKSQVCVQNGLNLRLFDSSKSTWASGSFNDSSFSKYGTFILSDSSIYHYLQGALQGVVHTSNQILANQSDCPKELSLHEHYAFGTLRSGPRLQWMNIVRGLEENAFTFRREEVYMLHAQAAWQVGMLCQDGRKRDWHTELESSEFSRLLLRQASRVLDRVRANWLEGTTVHIIVVLVARLLSATADIGVFHDAYNLLRDARAVTFAWFGELLVKLQNAEAECEILDYRRRVCEMAAICRSTYDVDEGHLDVLLVNEDDFLPLIHCSVQLHDNQPPKLDEVSHYLKMLLCRDRRLSFKLLPVILRRLQDCPKILDVSISQHWNGYRAGSSGWVTISNSHFGWIMTHTSSLDNSPSQHVHLNLLEGRFLVSGQPLGHLPRDYAAHQTYTRLFGQKVIDVVPANLSNMVFASRSHFDGNEVLFSLEGTSGELIIQAIRDGIFYELIPHSKLRGDFPLFLLLDYHHWINLQTCEVEFRPLDKPWTPCASNWIIRYLEGPGIIVEKRTQYGALYLLDIHGPVFRQISHQLRPLEISAYMHITCLNPNDPEINIELVRMKLEFFVNEESHIESRNFREQIIDEQQSSGTMFGLQDHLVLRTKDPIARRLAPSRTVLIPYGAVSFGPQGYHTEVKIDRGLGRIISIYQYKIDHDLGYLAGNNASLTSRLFKIYLHALTSHCLPDPLLGRTGTEEALRELDEKTTTSFAQIDIEEAQLLKLIGELTPRHRYYPPNRRVMQSVSWASLPALAQHYAFHVAANSALDRARCLQLFSPLNFNLDDYTYEFEVTLLKRAIYRTRLCYPADAVGHLLGKPGEASNSDCLYQGKDFMSNDWTRGAQLAAWGSGLAHGRWGSSIHQTLDLISQLEDLDTVDGIDSSPELGLTFSLDWLDLDLATSFMSIYNMCREAIMSENQYGLCICLSTGLYCGSLSPELSSFLVYLTVGSSSESLEPPTHALYRFSDGYQPSMSRLSKLINNSRHSMDSTPSNDIQIGKYESTSDLIQLRIKHYSENVSQYESQLARRWMDCWPAQPEIQLTPFSLWFDVFNCAAHVRAYFESCSRNADIKRHLSQVSGMLSSAPLEAEESYLNMPPALRTENTQKPCPMFHTNLVSLDTLLTRLIRCTSPDFTLQPTIAPSSNTSAPPDTTHLKGLLSGIWGNSAHPLRFRYGSDLEESRIILSQSNVLIPPRQLPPLDELLLNLSEHRTRLQARTGVMIDILGPRTVLENILFVTGVWPRLTPRDILGRLALHARSNIPTESLPQLLKYARSYVDYQRSQRLVIVALEGKHEEFYQELNLENTSCENGMVHPDWLLAQIDGNFSIRGIQAQVAREMISPSSGASTVLQLNMGEGKSSVIVPIVAAALADTTRFVRVVVLKPLWRQMFHLLVSRLSGLVNRRIYYLPFGRHIRVSESQAMKIQELYEECMREGGVLLVQPEHVLSFKLMGIDQLLLSSPEGKAAAHQLRRMQRWLSENARDILDESDEILHVRYQLVYTVGEQELLEGHPDRWKIIQQILSLVAGHIQRLKQHYPDKLGYEARHAGQFPFIRIMPDSSEVIAEITRLVAADAIAGRIPVLNFHALPKAVQKIAFRYLIDRNIPRNEMSSLVGLSASLRNGLLLLRGLLACGIITFALKDKHYRVDYGLHLERSLLAVPYNAKDIPSLRAEFGHPDVAIVLTCLSYYNSGLTEDQLHTCFELLYKQDNPALEYEQWTRSNETTPSHLLQLNGVNLKDREQFSTQLFPTFSANVAAVNFFLSAVVFPKEAKQFPHKLSTSGWDLVEVKKHNTTGFSGTNDNRYLLPMSITQSDPVNQSSTNALVLTYLLQPENNFYLCTRGANGKAYSATEFIETLVNQQPEIRVLLDVGAQMLELKNEELVRYWLKVRPDIAAAVYFNDRDELVILPQNGSPTSFFSSPFAQQMDKCIVYLDDGHTRGTDLKLPRTTRAAVTLGPKVTKDRLLQGCMRMRKLGFGQSVMFCAPPEIDLQIRKEAGLPLGAQITTTDVIRWAMLETCRDLERNISHWAQQGIEYSRRANAELAFSESTSPEVLKKGWLTPESRSLEEMYGVSGSADSGSDVFTRQALENPYLRSRLAVLGILKLDDPSLAEEQEREVSHEIERERQVERPLKSQPLAHRLHPDVKGYVQNGTIPSDPTGIVNLFQPLSSFETFYSGTWSQNLLASVDFCQTVQEGRVARLGEYMRPLHWVLCGPKETLLALSPYEADQLLPDIRKSEHVRLHVFAPRVTHSMLSMTSLKFYSTPSLNLRSLPLPKMLIRLQLSLFAGQLYFDDYAQYRVACVFLGVLYCAQADIGAEVIRAQNDGFIPEMGRRILAAYMPEYFDSGFTTSPIESLKDLIGYRRKGLEYLRTHIGQMLHGQQLMPHDF